MVGAVMVATETAGALKLPHSAGQAPAGSSCRHLVEVGQRKHGLRARQVLGQTALSHFGEAPQLLDYPKGVFAARPGPRTRPVNHSPALAQGPPDGRASIDPVAHSQASRNLRSSSFQYA